MKRVSQISFIEKTYLVLLVVIFGGIVLQAPLSVGLGTLFPSFDLVIKAWKEILMAIAALLLVVILYQKKQLRLLKDPLMIGVGIYGLLHVFSAAISTQPAGSILSGLLIDLRYVLFFALVYIAAKLYPTLRVTFIKVGIAGALVVMLFAILQVFVLPADILKYIGYNIHTIMPYLTVDQNTDYIRINSTLRGPNPLGAYAVIVLAGLLAFWLRGKHEVNKRPMAYVGILLIGSIVALWASYSRSALIAAVVMLIAVVGIVFSRRLGKRAWTVIGIVAIVIAMGLYFGRHTTFVSNVILHENPVNGSSVNSNQGHISSLQDGVTRLFSQPFGAGVGTTGSASLSTNAPLIIENQYLFIAHEVGWLGLALFITITIGVLTRLWQRRADWLALAVLASGIGMVVIGLLLPVWVDDTVSIVWWGLAGLAIGGKSRA